MSSLKRGRLLPLVWFWWCNYRDTLLLYVIVHIWHKIRILHLINFCFESSISLLLFIKCSHVMIYNVSFSVFKSIPWRFEKTKSLGFNMFISILSTPLNWQTPCAYSLIMHLYLKDSIYFLLGVLWMSFELLLYKSL